MKISHGLWKLNLLVTCLGLGGALPLLPQNSPPLPPAPPPPTKRIGPPLRPVPLRTEGDAAKPAAAVAPVPVPLVAPALATPKPLLPSPVLAPIPASVPPANPGALVFDAEQKEYAAKVGEATANFTFNLTNVSSSEVLINRVTTSCGCTVAKLPEQPWHVVPGTNGPIGVTVDLHGKSGTIMKSVTVDSTAGMKVLLVKVTIPPPQLIPAATVMDRSKNLALAQADRQAVFKAECAECHLKPALGKLGKELYAGACAVCHDAEHRATMVPDLHIFKHPETREYWAYTIAEGKANSLMPAFAQKSGGILTEQQLASLVDYMITDFAKETKAAPHTATARLSPSPSPQASAAPSTGLGTFPLK